MKKIRIDTFRHPDSINVQVWTVEQYVPCTGKYATAGDMYWKNITPGVERVFTTEAEAKAFAEAISDGQ